MPLYEYACNECRHEFETLLFPGEEAECPQCHSHQLERRLTTPARPAADRTAPLPMGCDPNLPPCGPACRRFNAG